MKVALMLLLLPTVVAFGKGAAGKVLKSKTRPTAASPARVARKPSSSSRDDPRSMSSRLPIGPPAFHRIEPPTSTLNSLVPSERPSDPNVDGRGTEHASTDSTGPTGGNVDESLHASNDDGHPAIVAAERTESNDIDIILLIDGSTGATDNAGADSALRDESTAPTSSVATEQTIWGTSSTVSNLVAGPNGHDGKPAASTSPSVSPAPHATVISSRPSYARSTPAPSKESRDTSVTASPVAYFGDQTSPATSAKPSVHLPTSQATSEATAISSRPSNARSTPVPSMESRDTSMRSLMPSLAKNRHEPVGDGASVTSGDTSSRDHSDEQTEPDLMDSAPTASPSTLKATSSAPSSAAYEGTIELAGSSYEPAYTPSAADLKDNEQTESDSARGEVMGCKLSNATVPFARRSIVVRYYYRIETVSFGTGILETIEDALAAEICRRRSEGSSRRLTDEVHGAASPKDVVSGVCDARGPDANFCHVVRGGMTMLVDEESSRDGDADLVSDAYEEIERAFDTLSVDDPRVVAVTYIGEEDSHLTSPKEVNGGSDLDTARVEGLDASETALVIVASGALLIALAAGVHRAFTIRRRNKRSTNAISGGKPLYSIDAGSSKGGKPTPHSVGDDRSVAHTVATTPTECDDDGQSAMLGISPRSASPDQGDDHPGAFQLASRRIPPPSSAPAAPSGIASRSPVYCCSDDTERHAKEFILAEDGQTRAGWRRLGILPEVVKRGDDGRGRLEGRLEGILEEFSSGSEYCDEKSI